MQPITCFTTKHSATYTGRLVHMSMHACTHKHTHTHTHTHARAHAHTFTLSHKCTHRRIHTNTNKQIHTNFKRTKKKSSWLYLSFSPQTLSWCSPDPQSAWKQAKKKSRMIIINIQQLHNTEHPYPCWSLFFHWGIAQKSKKKMLRRWMHHEGEHAIQVTDSISIPFQDGAYFCLSCCDLFLMSISAASRDLTRSVLATSFLSNLEYSLWSVVWPWISWKGTGKKQNNATRNCQTHQWVWQMKTATLGPDEGRVDLRKSIPNFHSLFPSAHLVKPFLAEIYSRELVHSVHMCILIKFLSVLASAWDVNERWSLAGKEWRQRKNISNEDNYWEKFNWLRKILPLQGFRPNFSPSPWWNLVRASTHDQCSRENRKTPLLVFDSHDVYRLHCLQHSFFLPDQMVFARTWPLSYGEITLYVATCGSRVQPRPR